MPISLVDSDALSLSSIVVYSLIHPVVLYLLLKFVFLFFVFLFIDRVIVNTKKIVLKISGSGEEGNEKYILTREQIAERLNCYMFEGIDTIHRFLGFMCEKYPDRIDYLYIRGKLGKILSQHDDKSSYFIPLRELACEIDMLIFNGVGR